MQTRFNAFAPTGSSLQRFGAGDKKKKAPEPINTGIAAQLARIQRAQDSASFDHSEDKPTAAEDAAFQKELKRLTPGRLTPQYVKAHSPQLNKNVGNKDKTEDQYKMDDIMETLPGLMGKAQKGDAEAQNFIAELRKILKTPPPKEEVPPGEMLQPKIYNPEAESSEKKS